MRSLEEYAREGIAEFRKDLNSAGGAMRILERSHRRLHQDPGIKHVTSAMSNIMDQVIREALEWRRGDPNTTWDIAELSANQSMLAMFVELVRVWENANNRFNAQFNNQPNDQEHPGGQPEDRGGQS